MATWIANAMSSSTQIGNVLKKVKRAAIAPSTPVVETSLSCSSEEDDEMNLHDEIDEKQDAQEVLQGISEESDEALLLDTRLATMVHKINKLKLLHMLSVFAKLSRRRSENGWNIESYSKAHADCDQASLRNIDHIKTLIKFYTDWTMDDVLSQYEHPTPVKISPRDQCHSIALVLLLQQSYTLAQFDKPNAVIKPIFTKEYTELENKSKKVLHSGHIYQALLNAFRDIENQPDPYFVPNQGHHYSLIPIKIILRTFQDMALQFATRVEDVKNWSLDVALTNLKTHRDCLNTIETCINVINSALDKPLYDEGTVRLYLAMSLDVSIEIYAGQNSANNCRLLAGNRQLYTLAHGGIDTFIPNATFAKIFAIMNFKHDIELTQHAKLLLCFATATIMKHAWFMSHVYKFILREKRNNKMAENFTQNALFLTFRINPYLRSWIDQAKSSSL